MDGTFPLIEDLKEVCFNVPLHDQTYLHSTLLDGLMDLFISRGFLVERERFVSHSHYYRTWMMPLKKKGFIDLYAFNDHWKVAIEFDTGNILKCRSIEKLLESGADIAIGIAGARCAAPVLQSNIRKVMKASEYAGPIKNKFWIILLGKRVAEEIGRGMNGLTQDHSCLGPGRKN
jgi:hypothetical protein